MSERGYRYTAPRMAMTALADGFHQGSLGIDELRKAEVDTATADATCYQDAGLTELTAAARDRAERVVLARAQHKAQDLRRAIDDAVARAEALLGDPAAASAH